MSPESCSKLSSKAGKPRHIPLRQSRLYQPRACFLFRLSLRVDPVFRWPALKSFSSTYRFQPGKTLSTNLSSGINNNVVGKTGNLVCAWSRCWCALLVIVAYFFAHAYLLFTSGSTTAAADVQGKLFATKEGLPGMRRAARFAEDTAELKLGVRKHGGLKG